MNKQQRSRRRERRRAARAERLTLHDRIARFLSNFRLSLTFRIALHYAWQLLCTTLPVLLVLTLALGAAQLAELESTIRRIQQGAADRDGNFTQMVLQRSDMAATLSPEPFSGGTTPLLQYRITSLHMDGSIPVLVLEAQHATGQTICLTARLRYSASIWLWVAGAALLCDALRVVWFIRRRERLSKTVLSPIRDITEMATTLSANNLSNRINIAGTKNELKDLAIVINTMLDRIERSYNSQKQFVSDASHELRTPIAVIQGYIGMLDRWGKSDPEVLEEGIAAISQETASMKELVESLLFLARHDKKTLMMEMSRFDVLDVLTELHREAAMVTPEDTFTLSPTVSCEIEADRSMVKQVLRILCDNAVKYTPKGGSITLGVTHEPGWCTLSVTDNGPGISSDELPLIFDRFYRSDSARKSEGGGHGLGLSIARIIVIAHGGRLRVRSKVGSGTTFYVVLPEKQPQLHNNAGSAPSKPAAT